MNDSVVVVIVEVERQAVVDAYRREGGHRAVIRQPEDAGEKSCRRLLVADGHDHLVEFDSHGLLLVERTELKRSEEHTSELQSLMRISYAVFCLKKKKKIHTRAKQRS